MPVFMKHTTNCIFSNTNVTCIHLYFWTGMNCGMCAFFKLYFLIYECLYFYNLYFVIYRGCPLINLLTGGSRGGPGGPPPPFQILFSKKKIEIFFSDFFFSDFLFIFFRFNLFSQIWFFFFRVDLLIIFKSPDISIFEKSKQNFW